MSIAQNTYVSLDERGRPVIAGTGFKLVQFVMAHRGDGAEAQELHQMFPYLSLAQIHGALAYYYDHQAEIDAEIELQLREYDALRTEMGPGPISEKLKALGKLP